VTQLIERRPRNARFLRLAGLLAEQFDDLPRALECWRTLVSGTAQGSAAWYEAKFHQITVLVQIDPDRARSVLAQHRLLHPDYGPKPWGERLRRVAAELGPPPDPAPDGATEQGAAPAAEADGEGGS
jgi:hypothetical protein